MTGVTLFFSNRSKKKSYTYHKRGKGRINVFLDSIHHLVDHDDQKCFNKELSSFYNAIPWNAELLAGQYVNSNIGVVLIIEILKVNTSYFYSIVLNLEC